jgi:hypothetical protein
LTEDKKDFLFNKLGLIDNGPELQVSKEELWNKISNESKDIFKIITEAPEEMYQLVFPEKKKSLGEWEIKTVGIYIIKKYLKKKFNLSIRQSEKVIRETMKYSLNCLALDRIDIR